MVEKVIAGDIIPPEPTPEPEPIINNPEHDAINTTLSSINYDKCYNTTNYTVGNNDYTRYTYKNDSGDYVMIRVSEDYERKIDEIPNYVNNSDYENINIVNNPNGSISINII